MNFATKHEKDFTSELKDWYKEAINHIPPSTEKTLIKIAASFCVVKLKNTKASGLMSVNDKREIMKDAYIQAFSKSLDEELAD
jgi:hypothetical protein